MKNKNGYQANVFFLFFRRKLRVSNGKLKRRDFKLDENGDIRHVTQRLVRPHVRSTGVHELVSNAPSKNGLHMSGFERAFVIFTLYKYQSCIPHKSQKNSDLLCSSSDERGHFRGVQNWQSDHP